MFRALVLILGIASAVTSAEASGLWFTRSPTSTTFRDCSGSLVEKFVSDSAVTSEGRDYMLICLTGENKAAWVFRAGFHCDSTLGDDAKNDPYHMSPTWCKDELYKSLSDRQVMVTDGHAFDKKDVEWRFTRYGIGTDCSYRMTPIPNWTCKDVKVRFDQDLTMTTKATKTFEIDTSHNATWFATFSNTVEVACYVGRHGSKQDQEVDCSGKDTTF